MTDAPDPPRSAIFAGTTVALDGNAAMFRGPSGSGKSDLALRCLGLHGFSGAVWNTAGSSRFGLVSDDQTVIMATSDGLIADAPSVLRGRLEVRGIGIVEFPPAPRARLCVVVDLAAGAPERLPLAPRHAEILGWPIPCMTLDPFEASAVAKVEIAIRCATGGLALWQAVPR